MYPYASAVVIMTTVLGVDVVTKTSVLSVESIVLLITGISATAALIWKGRGEFDRISKSIDALQKTVDSLPCVKGERKCDASQRRAV